MPRGRRWHRRCIGNRRYRLDGRPARQAARHDHLARKAASIIRQNIALSLAAIAALDAAAVTGHMSLAAGLLLNEGSALLIIANGLRLLRRPAPQSVPPPQTSPQPDLPESQPAGV